MKIFFALLLVALFASVLVSAQSQQQQYNGFRARATTPGKRHAVRPIYYKLPSSVTGRRYTHPTAVESDKFWKKLIKTVGQIGKGAVKAYINQHFEQVEADYRPFVNETATTTPKRRHNGFNKLKKLYKLYKLTKKLRKEKVQSDKFFKKLFKVVKQVGKGYINQHFDEEADFKFGKLLKKVGLKLGKAYLRTQGIPLEDELVVTTKRRAVRRHNRGPRRHYKRRAQVESDKFFKKIGKLFKKALPYLKAGVKEYVNNNLADSQLSAGEIAANYARSQIGACYSQQQRLGNPCFDCSGLVLKSWEAAGRNVPSYTGAYTGGLRDVTG
ncbi:hypothetical protein ABK040_008549 [Willaertia magna]